MTGRARLAAVVVATLLTACSSGGDPVEETRPEVDPEVRPATTASSTTTTTAPVESTESIADVAVRLTEVGRVDDSPLAMAVRPGAADQVFVAVRPGRLVRFELSGGGRLDSGEVVLDFSGDVSTGGERGFLGVAFAPDGSRLYTSYTNTDGDTRVDEYRMEGDAVDTASRREVFAQDQPFPNHNGGNIVFGPDGYLYVGLGDGGGAGDPLEAGQDPAQLLGKILRIDPLGGETPYGVPDDNPFADGGGRPEIWISGVRNPWRFAFDRATGDLWVADVGQNAVEEIDFLPEGSAAGANLGWNQLEGDRPFDEGGPPPDAVAPVFTYTHDGGGCSITGGFVYRGEAIPDLRGAYLYGDLCLSDIRAVLARDGAVAEERSLGVSVDPNNLVSFGEDATGEVYVLSADGAILRVDQA